MAEAKVTVYGAYWCPDCRRSKRFLGEQFIPYQWVDIEQDKVGEAFVLQKNNGKRTIPMILFEDGSFLVEPSNAELAKKLGLKTEAKKIYYDLIIIGGRPAGLTAAIYAAREGAETVACEDDVLRLGYRNPLAEFWHAAPQHTPAPAPTVTIDLP